MDADFTPEQLDRLRQIEALLGEGVDLGPLINNHSNVQNLQYAVMKAPQDIDLLRRSMRNCISGQCWTKRYNPHTKEFTLYVWSPPEDAEKRREQFLRFVSDPPERGLGTTVETLLRLLEGTPEYVTVVELTARGKGGERPGQPRAEDGTFRNVRNSNIADQPQPSAPQPARKPKGGTENTPYRLRRLSRERPDLLEKVKAGELSAHKAMVQAGFRKVPTPLDLLRAAWGKASEEERNVFLSEVLSGGS